MCPDEPQISAHLRRDRRQRRFCTRGCAAELTQSAASRQIQALEDELGLRLFARIGRSVRLTREGEDLLVRSLQSLFDADALGQRASALKTGEVGVLRVGATPQVIESLLADFLLRYRKRYGGCRSPSGGGRWLPLAGPPGARRH